MTSSGSESRGTYKDLRRNMWTSRVMFEGKSYFLGIYPTEHEAHQAYLRKLIALLTEKLDEAAV